MERNTKKVQKQLQKESLAVILTIDREVRIILELPGAKKEYIKINANENVIEIKTTVSIRKY